MQLLIFGFHRPAIKIKFLKHCLRDEWIEKIGSEVFFCAVIESDFNDTDVNVRGTVLGIARKKSMDITYLNGLHKEMFYYLYLFSDLYDRSIVGGEVYEEESAEHASELIQQICLKQGRPTTQPLVLHSDNGSPMKGATMLATLYQLGITPSNSPSFIISFAPCPFSSESWKQSRTVPLISSSMSLRIFAQPSSIAL